LTAQRVRARYAILLLSSFAAERFFCLHRLRHDITPSAMLRCHTALLRSPLLPDAFIDIFLRRYYFCRPITPRHTAATPPLHAATMPATPPRKILLTPRCRYQRFIDAQARVMARDLRRSARPQPLEQATSISRRLFCEK